MNLLDTIQDPLIKAVLAEFFPRFTPGGLVLWVAARSDKLIYQSRTGLARCGIRSLPRRELPNVGILNSKDRWLGLIDVARIRGSMTSERREALEGQFRSCPVRLVFVTAFQSRREFRDYFRQPAWRTAAWFSEEPGHLVHFDS